MLWSCLRVACGGIAAFVLLFAVACVPAEAPYPVKPVEIITLDPAGGPTDIVARALVDAAQPNFPQPLVVLNKPGGAGTIAASEVVRAAPDGYTLGLQAVGPMALQPYRTQLPYKSPDDYEPVINLVRQPLVLAVRADAPWRSLAQLIDAARAQPDTLRVGLPGAGTIADVNLDLLAERTGATFTRVHFNSAPETVRALLGGDVHAVVVGPPGLISPVKAGTARVLGTFEAERNPNFPEAPTFRELGYDITLGGYFFVIAPKGTPPGVVAKLHDTFKVALESEQFRTIAVRSGFVLDYQSPEALRRRLGEDYAMFGRLVKP